MGKQHLSQEVVVQKGRANDNEIRLDGAAEHSFGQLSLLPFYHKMFQPKRVSAVWVNNAEFVKGLLKVAAGLRKNPDGKEAGNVQQSGHRLQRRPDRDSFQEINYVAGGPEADQVPPGTVSFWCTAASVAPRQAQHIRS